MPADAEMTSIHNGIGRIALDLTALLSEVTGVYRSIIQ